MENIKEPILQIKDVCISYTSSTMAVKHVSADIQKNTITAIMGPSGCGKSTLLRAVNRMHELYKNIRVTGEILLNGENVLQMQPMEERRRIGMVFQRPNPFPTMNIYDNVLAGYLLNGIRLSKSEKDEIVERNLRSVALWDEVKDSLTKRGTFLSGGQHHNEQCHASGYSRIAFHRHYHPDICNNTDNDRRSTLKQVSKVTDNRCKPVFPIFRQTDSTEHTHWYSNYGSKHQHQESTHNSIGNTPRNILPRRNSLHRLICIGSCLGNE